MNWPIPKPGTTVTEAELLSLGIDPRAPVGKREPGPALDVRCGDDRYTRRASDGGVTVHYNDRVERPGAASGDRSARTTGCAANGDTE